MQRRYTRRLIRQDCNKNVPLFPAQWANKGPPPPPPPPPFRIPSREFVTLPPPHLTSSRRRHSVYNFRDEAPSLYNTEPGRSSGTRETYTSVDPRMMGRTLERRSQLRHPYDYPLSSNMPCSPGMSRTSDDNHALLASSATACIHACMRAP